MGCRHFGHSAGLACSDVLIVLDRREEFLARGPGGRLVIEVVVEHVCLGTWRLLWEGKGAYEVESESVCDWVVGMKISGMGGSCRHCGGRDGRDGERPVLCLCCDCPLLRAGLRWSVARQLTPVGVRAPGRGGGRACSVR